MFAHEKFDHYRFEEVPLDRDIFVVGERWLKPYEEMMLRFFDGAEYDASVGIISWFAARSISEDAIEMSWIVDMSTRYHELSVSLPRSEFVVCVGSWQASERPRVFVTDTWLDHIHLRNYSIFALVDAIGVKDRIRKGTLTTDSLLGLRASIDELASRHPDASFVSFGDSLLIKINWTVGMFDREVGYSYSPEVVLPLIQEVSRIYREALGLEIYAVITQGTNDYYGSAPIHIAPKGNHVCMNCLGVPFETIFAIDDAVRQSLRASAHPKAQLYIDEQYYRSLQLPYDFKSNSSPPMHEYRSRMSEVARKYIPCDAEELLAQIDRENINAIRRKEELAKRNQSRSRTRRHS